MFRKTATTLGIITAVVLLAGCPYSSSVPVDEGTIKIDDRLAGQWISTADTETANAIYFVITKDDNFHASAIKKEFSSSDRTYNETKSYLLIPNL